MKSKSEVVQRLEEPPVAKFLFGDTRFAWFWLILRLYVGWQWLQAGYEKLTNPAWIGSSAGTGIAGFVKGALAKTTGDHPAVQNWYGGFLQSLVLPNPVFWSYVITFGELLVGVALVLGIFTGLAAFFGGFMNVNYLLAGTVSTNPLLFVFATWIVLAWRIAGWWGLDRWILPALARPFRPGLVFRPRSEALEPR